MKFSVNTLSKPFVVTLLAFLSSQSNAVEPAQCQAGVILPGDKDRGCCVYKTTPTVCAMANRGFCRTTADEANQAYKFYKGATCSNIVQCKKPAS